MSALPLGILVWFCALLEHRKCKLNITLLIEIIEVREKKPDLFSYHLITAPSEFNFLSAFSGSIPGKRKPIFLNQILGEMAGLIGYNSIN